MSLTVHDLRYAYGPKTALNGISFDIPKGAFCALLGPNGAGKSTLFALLTRLFTSREGRISVAGHDLSTNPRRALSEIGVVFQQPSLDLDLTVHHNLKYFAALHGLSGNKAETRINAVLTRLDMAERARETVRALNGGHRRRTEIARALIHRPSVLLLDEPTVGLDAASRSAITRHVHQLAAEDGLTVLWATHLTDEIWPDDHLLVLHQGQILADDRCSNVTKGQPLIDCFLSMTGAKA